jgi:2-hydroxychromene-2-carboxylate isomerase
MTNRAAIELDWYFDFISPFAYLQLEQFERLPAHVQVTFKPIVLGALLSHWETKGPAEIPEKRRVTYRYAHFRAEHLAVPFRMPPEHPFNPIKLLRLAIALGCTRDVVREIFRFVRRDGRAVETDQDWIALCERLGHGVADDALARADVKLSLRHNTDQAIVRGVFGVPTFAWGDDLFWGEDSTALLLHYLSDPAWLQSDELCRISALPTGVQRNV